MENRGACKTKNRNEKPFAIINPAASHSYAEVLSGGVLCSHSILFYVCLKPQATNCKPRIRSQAGGKHSNSRINPILSVLILR